MTSELHEIAARYERVDPSVGDVGKVPTARELLASKQKEEWLITELACRGSLLVIAGDTGSSKTTFLYGMAQAMSVGEPFMGQLTTQKSKVLVIQADESERNSQRKLQVMGIDPEFHFITDMKTLDMRHLNALQQQEGYDAILLDSITTLLGKNHDGPKMNDAEFGFALYDLNDWASAQNVLVGMTCHLRKQGRDTTTNKVKIGDLFGAGSQGWAASDVWAIWKADEPDMTLDTHLMLRCLKGRFCEEGTAWNVDGCKEDYSHRLHSVADQNDVLPMRRSEIADQVCDLIRGSEKRWTTNEISREISCNPEHARRVLQKLFTQGELIREKLPHSGGRPKYVYADLDFSYISNTPPQ